jgi:drug/metabolite transporter (DMT)-like permease
LLRPVDATRLVILAAIWGAAYLFMRVALPYASAIGMVEVRTLLASVLLFAFAAVAAKPVAFRAYWPHYLVVGATQAALPFALIGYALRDIDASTAAILNATSPLFSAAIAAFWIRDPLTAPKLLGITLCIVGVGVLVGWTPRPMSGVELMACGLSVSASALYGFASVYAKVHLKGAPSIGVAAGLTLFAALIAAPLTPWHRLAQPMPVAAWLSLIGLGVLCTGIAFILYFRLITDIGPVRAMTVTLLVPVFGVFWGVLLLGDPLTPGRILGGAIILVGCGLILGLLRLPAKVTAG